jgi:hypothetical protein
MDSPKSTAQIQTPAKTDRVKVKILQHLVGTMIDYKPGREVEFSAVEAYRLVQRGLAEYVGEAPEAPVMPPSPIGKKLKDIQKATNERREMASPRVTRIVSRQNPVAPVGARPAVGA